MRKYYAWRMKQAAWWRSCPSNVPRPQLRWCWPMFCSVVWLAWRGFELPWTTMMTTPPPPPPPPLTAPLFSPEWAVQYAMGNQGCNLGRGSFVWRGHGLGSNINNMLNAWVYALAVEHWIDIAVIIADDQMRYVECDTQSLGQASTGWGCLFLPMPHLCTFPTDEAWQSHMKSKDATTNDLAEAARLDQDAVRFHPEQIVASLDGLEVDHLGALAVVAKYLWSNITPWMQSDVNSIANSGSVSDVFDQSPFLGLHVRRGDKVRLGEAGMHNCEEYLDAAVAYLEGEESELDVEDIKGIWVASDDDRVVEIIKEIAPSYLPNVDSTTIYWASGGVEGGPELRQMATRTDKATYADFAYALADLQRCATADVFVGTFSSNMGRLLVLLRETIGLKPRGSSISVDGPWGAGRRRHQRRNLEA